MQTVHLTEQAVREHLDQLTKPPGSLGRLEDLATVLCRIQGTLQPVTRAREIVLFAGDHGVVASGVSAWPSDVTGLMVANIAGGGAASNALAASTNTQLRLVDVGCMGPMRDSGGLFTNARVASGTKNMSQEPAMDLAEWERALSVGKIEAKRASAAGARILAAGEMGIGNTTPSTCLAALLCGLDVLADNLVGAGAGADSKMVAAKSQLIADVVAKARLSHNFAKPGCRDARTKALAAVAGFELVAMAGYYIEGAQRGAVLVIDGLIASAAALIAEDLEPGTARNMIAAHRSMEPAHVHMLSSLGLEPFLDWNLRLGEGTGALLLMPMLDAAAAIITEMATFADLGIVPE